MKKIFALILCAFLVVALPVATYAEEVPSETVEETTTEATLPEQIVAFITENYTGSSLLSLAITVVVYLFFEIKKHKNLSGSIGVLNNNAVAIAEKSAESIQRVLAEAQDVASVVLTYKDEMEKMLGEIRKNAEEKQSLEDTLKSVEEYLNTAKLANIELANELAELLCLANIPNSKKDELYSRHLTAVATISEAGHTEVKADDGKEA